MTAGTVAPRTLRSLEGLARLPCRPCVLFLLLSAVWVVAHGPERAVGGFRRGGSRGPGTIARSEGREHGWQDERCPTHESP
jgi:hypothetical protein